MTPAPWPSSGGKWISVSLIGSCYPSGIAFSTPFSQRRNRMLGWYIALLLTSKLKTQLLVLFHQRSITCFILSVKRCMSPFFFCLKILKRMQKSLIDTGLWASSKKTVDNALTLFIHKGGIVKLVVVLPSRFIDPDFTFFFFFFFFFWVACPCRINLQLGMSKAMADPFTLDFVLSWCWVQTCFPVDGG